MSRDTRDRVLPDASSVQETAQPAPTPTAAPGPPAHAPASKEDDELLRRAERVITYIWGEAPPFKDLADVLADIRSALQSRSSRKA
jgi:hypothetical protein